MAVLRGAPGGRRRWAAVAALAAVLWIATAVAQQAVAAPASPTAAARAQAKEVEYKVKAAFLYNFAKFVDWPADAFADARSPFNLCVLGEDPFGSSLDQTVVGESIGGRPIAVQRGAHLVELKGCHILFVSRSEEGKLREVIAALHNGPVLTVGDGGGFLASGGMIDFVLEGGKLRFEVNRGAVDRSPLKISSKLLRLARLYSEPAGGGG